MSHAAPVGPYAGMTFNPTIVDDAHERLCGGCPTCSSAEDRWMRRWMQIYGPPPTS